jgi:hypothetical protein
MKNRTTHTEYVVRISSPKCTHKTFLCHCKQFNKAVCESIRVSILAAARNALREHIRKGKLAEGFRVDIR